MATIPCIHCGVPLPREVRTCHTCDRSQLDSPIWERTTFARDTTRHPATTYMRHINRFSEIIRTEVEDLPRELQRDLDEIVPAHRRMATFHREDRRDPESDVVGYYYNDAGEIVDFDVPTLEPCFEEAATDSIAVLIMQIAAIVGKQGFKVVLAWCLISLFGQLVLSAFAKWPLVGMIMQGFYPVFWVMFAYELFFLLRLLFAFVDFGDRRRKRTQTTRPFAHFGRLTEKNKKI